jgi:hypothetical protein
VPPVTTELLQWLVNQGLGVLATVAVFYVLIVKVDHLDHSIQENTLATQNLVALVALHMPPPRARHAVDE